MSQLLFSVFTHPHPCSFPPFLPPSLREHLDYHAIARMGGKHSKDEARERVSEVMEEVGLTKAANTVIGGDHPLYMAKVSFPFLPSPLALPLCSAPPTTHPPSLPPSLPLSFLPSFAFRAFRAESASD